MTSVYENLTICIFTRNRHEKLTKIVRYWEALDVNVIILDASDQAFEFDFGLNITYLHKPMLPIDVRLMMFRDLVKTKYILLSPDDDFFLPKALELSLAYLEVNLDYSSVQGLRIRLFDDLKPRWIPDYTKQSKLVFDSDDALERLRTMSSSMHYVYSIQRTDVYSEIVNALSGTQTTKRDSDTKIELVFNYLLPVFGKHRILPMLFSARTYHEYEGHDIQFSNWINDPKDSSALKFKSNIRDTYISKLHCTPLQANEIEGEITAHYSQTRDPEFDLLDLKPLPKNSLPESIKGLIKNSPLRYFWPVSKIEYLRYFLVLLQGKHFLTYFKDLHFLLKFLRSI
jgi:glycosyltransferase domain-containing protein